MFKMCMHLHKHVTMLRTACMWKHTNNMRPLWEFVHESTSAYVLKCDQVQNLHVHINTRDHVWNLHLCQYMHLCQNTTLIETCLHITALGNCMHVNLCMNTDVTEFGNSMCEHVPELLQWPVVGKLHGCKQLCAHLHMECSEVVYLWTCLKTACISAWTSMPICYSA